MNNEYKILWFDDNANSQKAFAKRLKSQLGRLGFGLAVEYYQTADMTKVYALCERLRVYNEFDLIMFDHKLEGMTKGAKYAAEFRKNKIYTDMVYYSSSDIETLWTALRREKVDGVYILNRDGMDNDLIRIVKEQVARVFDVSNMRGYILQFMSQIEGALRSSLANEMHNDNDDCITSIISNDEVSVANKKIRKMKSLTKAKCEMAIVDGSISFDRVRTVLSKVKSGEKAFFDQASLLFKLQRIRNMFAHRRHKIDQENHRLFLEGDKTQPQGYSAEDFKDLRLELMSLSKMLEPIIGTI